MFTISTVAMSNTYFQFKQFIIQQQNTAMKVCTDACLFGAWAANKLKSKKGEIENVLDVGTGTGLLSLMIAQKTDARIDAVEINSLAAQQAKENFAISAWKNRLQVIEEDIRNFNVSKKYDFIISNPPFFKDDLKSENYQRNLALHSEALSYEELLISSAKLLMPGGFLAVLLPFRNTSSFIQSAIVKNFFVHEKVLVKQTEKHSAFRAMLLLSQKASEEKQFEIIIKKEGKYSVQFTELLTDYYL